MSFRFASKRIHLTYSGHLSLDDEPGSLFSFLCGLGDVECFSFVHEAGHANGEEGESYDHTHAYVQWKKRVQSRNARFLDWMGIHPHIQKINDDHHATTIYESYHHKAPLLLKQSECAPQGNKETVQRIRDANSLWEAVQIAGVEIKTVNDVKLIRDDVERPQEFKHRYPDAQWTLEVPENFRTLFVYGGTGTGKTQWAVHCFENPLIVSHMDDLGRFTKKNDGIVFDDMSFSHMPREACIHLLDWEMDRSIHIRYKTATIPSETRKIFTSNKSFEECFPTDESGALRRRISRIIHVKGSTFTNGQETPGPLLLVREPTGLDVQDDDALEAILNSL
jgi:hypothetical protein